MFQTQFSDRLAILVTNFHGQAPAQVVAGFDAEEERADRLGRILASGALASRVRRLGNRRETLPTTVAVQLQNEVSNSLKSLPADALVLFVISGHGVSTLTGEPALLARDVYVHMRQQGTLPLRWFHAELEAARPAHAVIIYDLEFLDGTEVDPASLLKKIPPPAVPCTQIWLKRAALPSHSGLAWLHQGFKGAMLSAEHGCITLRSLLEAAHSAHRPGGAPAVAVATTVQPPFDLALHAPVSIEPAPRDASGSQELLVDFRSQTLPKGTMLPNRIRVDQVVGRGGFGTVYLGEQVDLHRQVAIKVLLPSASVEPESVSLFLREMWSIARLKHHNIITLYHSGTLPDGQLFYVMEYLQGETLRDRLTRQRKLPVEKAVDFICQLLAGLEHAHGQGVVHRDIKPENLMIVPRPPNREGLVILDFGVARFKEDVAQAAAAGTPGYMRDDGTPHHADDQADLYSAGVVFFEMLTGFRPDELQGQNPTSALLEAGVPPRIRTTVTEALANKPSEGFQTAAAFLEALQGSGRDLSDDTARVIRARQPFRALTPFSAEETHIFFGRDQEVEHLLDRLMFSKVLLLMGPSGVGRTSLLRAGVGPKCDHSAMRAVHGDLSQPLSDLLRRIAPGSPTFRQAVRTSQFTVPRRIALLIDHVEALYLASNSREAERSAFEDQLVELMDDRTLDVCVLLSVRDDVLPALSGLRRRLNLAPSQEYPLRPLGVTAAYHAFSQPLRMARISVQGELVAQLQKDLTLACRELLPQDGSSVPFVFPPHLQVAGQALYDSLAPGQNQLTTETYGSLGRLNGILEKHVQQVTERHVAPNDLPLARRILLELTSADGSRQVRSEADLRSILEPSYAPPLVGGILALLHRHRILQPHAVGGQVHWQLSHDSFANWVRASIRNDEAEQRRLRELLLLRVRSPADEPGLLNSEELGALDVHAELVEELDKELAQLPEDRRPRWTISQLVDRSKRRRLRRRWAMAASLALLAAALTVAFFIVHFNVKTTYADVGRFYLKCSLFDGGWDETAPPSSNEFPFLELELLEGVPGDPTELGQPLDAMISRVDNPAGNSPLFLVEARSGSLRFVKIKGRHRRGESECQPSVVPLARTPGKELQPITDSHDAALELRIPSCRATRSRTVVVPAGVALIPPADSLNGIHHPTAVSEFRADRIEVSRHEFLPFGLWLANNGRFGLEGDATLPTVPDLVSPNLPATYIDAYSARLFCLWWGMDLPTREQWIKAARGGRTLDGDATALHTNPEPARRYPWGSLSPSLASPSHPLAVAAFLIQSSDSSQLHSADSYPDGASPYGLLHMAGNAAEWIRERQPRTNRDGWPTHAVTTAAMGGHFLSVSPSDLVIGAAEWLDPAAALPTVGFRCVEEIK